MKQLGVCVPPRPCPADPAFARPERWGCLRAPLQEALMARLEAAPDVRVVPLDVRDGRVVNGEVWVGSQRMSELDAYFWYCELDRTPGSYELELLKTLAARIPVVPNPFRWEVALDKYRAHHALLQSGLRVPEHVLFDARNLDALEPLLASWGGALLKPRRGAWGKGVHLLESFEALRDVVGYIVSVSGGAPDHGFLLERYYDNDISRWASLTVLGGEVVCAYQKEPHKVAKLAPGRFKVFDSGEQGGGVRPATIDAAQRELATAAARALGCPIIGFDLIATEAGPMVVDANTSPGNYPEIYAAFGRDPVEAFAAVALGALGEVASSS